MLVNCSIRGVDAQHTAATYPGTCLQFFSVSQFSDETIYQQDGAPPHFSSTVCTYLNKQIPARWIGRGSLYVTCSARSPDLTPPNFFLWGFVKDQIYKTPVHDLSDLEERIYATVINITSHMLHNIWIQVEYQWTFPVPLTEAMLRFMEHKVEKTQFSLFVAFGFIYKFVLVHNYFFYYKRTRCIVDHPVMKR